MFTKSTLPALDLRAVHIFVTVAAERSFRRAAERLHLSPASVSQSIKKLERQLGTELFDRTTHRVEVTSAGFVLLESASALLRAGQRLETTARQLAGARTLRVGTLFGLGADLVDRAATQAVASGLVSRVDLLGFGWQDPTCGLATAAVDVAILAGPTDHDGALVRRCVEVQPRMALVPAGSRLARRTAVSVRELDACGWAQVATCDVRWRGFWRLDDERRGPPPQHPDVHETPESLLFAIRRGRGVWTTPASLCEHFAHQVSACRPLLDVDPVPIDVAYRGDAEPSVIADFAAHVTSVVTPALDM